MFWKITYEAGKGDMCETLSDIVEAVDLQDAAEVRRWKLCAARMRRDSRRRRTS